MRFLHFTVLSFATALAAPHDRTPTARTKNGTYAGVYSPEYDQDFFLGIPYAQPPISNLRFRNPQSLNASWQGSKDANRYSPACVGYGASQMGYNVSEDCLYLNVVRPAGISTKKQLPVLLWIHGGGFVQGSGVDLRYNMSFIVQQSQEMGQPIIAATLNYRLSAFGFMQGYRKDDASTGGNWGLRDQRLALHWLRENVQGFGGDPNQVTIWGQSAGAASVGLHITAYNGRDDKLFKSAIMESGNPIYMNAMNNSAYPTTYQHLATQAGCGNATNTIQCLRELPFEQFNAALNQSAFSSVWYPQIDGDIIARHSSDQISDESFVKVPIISGANSDEGTSFAPKGLNTTEQFQATLMSANMNTSFAEKILDAYPLQSPENALANLGPVDFVPPAYPYGTQWRRVSTYYTDSTFVANRRLTCQTWSSREITAYCFNFNAIPSWAGPFDGATHFVEVAFAMKNLLGLGYPPVRTPPFQGLSEGYRQLATLMSGDWVSFVVNGDPNKWDRKGVMASLQQSVPQWEKYAGEVFEYEGNVTLGMRKDDWRKEGMNLVNSVNKAVYDR